MRTTVASADIGDIMLELLELGDRPCPRASFGILAALIFFSSLVEIGALVAFAELLLDRLDLLVQVVLALALLHLPLDAAADALFHLQDIDLALEQPEQVLQPLADVLNISRISCFCSSLSGRCARDGIGQAAAVVDA